MIKKLSIRNYTLIDELNIEFNSGFSVITGETGAGKSIILGALSLISAACRFEITNVPMKSR